MKRKFIVLGDKTSHGGQVIGASGAGCMTIDDIPVACIGDPCSCPKKGHSVCYIVQGADSPPSTLNGKQIAREGDKTSCGASLISAGQSRATHGGEGAGEKAAVITEKIAERQAWAAESRAEKAAAAAIAAAASGAGTDGAEEETNNYDEQVRIVDENNAPLLNVPYHITTEDGDVYKGVTDENGCCVRIYTSSPQNLDVLIGVPALEKW